MRAVRNETSKPDLKVFPDISDNPLSYHSSEDYNPIMWEKSNI